MPKNDSRVTFRIPLEKTEKNMDQYVNRNNKVIEAQRLFQVSGPPF